MQSKIRQVRRSNKYMFGYLIPRSYKEALEFDKENNNTKWADATRDEMDCIKEQEVFTTCQRVKWDSNYKKILNAPPNHQMIRVNLIFAVNIQLETQNKACCRWFSHPRTSRDYLLRSCFIKALKACDFPLRAQQP